MSKPFAYETDLAFPFRDKKTNFAGLLAIAPSRGCHSAEAERE
jgi:hypothetical protein